MVKPAKSLPNHDLANLESILGFAQTIAVRILAELGDIRRFSSPNKITEVIKGKGVKVSYHDQTASVGSNRLLADVNISPEMNTKATKLQNIIYFYSDNYFLNFCSSLLFISLFCNLPFIL